jgi:hypothetical protein
MYAGLSQDSTPSIRLTPTPDLSPPSQAQKKMNLTKTVRKVPIDLDLQKAGVAVDDAGSGHKPGGPKYDAEDTWVGGPGVRGGVRDVMFWVLH